MKISNTQYGYGAAANAAVKSTEEAKQPQEIGADEQAFKEESDRQDNISLSTEEWAKDDKNKSDYASASTFDGFKMDSKPKDSASNLTRRLVAATGQFEVRQIMADASKNMVELRMTAAMSKGEDAALARSYIKKLDKLIGRAGKKIKDLDEEDMLKLRKTRAEQEKQRERAEEIKAELRKKLTIRGARENGYLFENEQDKLLGRNPQSTGDNSSMKLDAASEAAIAAQADAIAAVEAEAVSIGAVDGGDFSAASAGEGAGAEVESASPEVSVDIAV